MSKPVAPVSGASLRPGSRKAPPFQSAEQLYDRQLGKGKQKENYGARPGRAPGACTHVRAQDRARNPVPSPRSPATAAAPYPSSGPLIVEQLVDLVGQLGIFRQRAAQAVPRKLFGRFMPAYRGRQPRNR